MSKIPRQKHSKLNSFQDVLLSVTNTFEGRLFVSQNFTENQTIAEYVAQIIPQFSDREIQETVAVYTGIGLDTVFDQATAIMGEGEILNIQRLCLRNALTL